MRAPISTGNKVSHKMHGAILVMAPLALTMLAVCANADPLQIVGYSGYLGEWELTATVTEESSSADKRYSGALLMKHVGICTQEGPEEKNGKISIRMPRSSSNLEATLWIDGVECSYRGISSDFYNGSMSCSGRPAVPLKLWVK
jgi:hypothetical protein